MCQGTEYHLQWFVYMISSMMHAEPTDVTRHIEQFLPVRVVRSSMAIPKCSALRKDVMQGREHGLRSPTREDARKVLQRRLQHRSEIACSAA